jgi:Cu(I)/Ag(I) efflux system membrane protein CusA/SilA
MVENAIEPSLRNKKKWITINNQPMKSYLKKIFKKEHDPLSADERMKLESSSKLVGPGVFLFNTYCNCFFTRFFY